MRDYYDPHPTVTLDSHLVLAGYFGPETRQVAFQLAAMTGLGVTDLDRKIEHHAGKSIEDLIWSEGEASYRRLERQYLESLLAERPNAILSLGDGALIDAANRSRVLEGARLIVLDLDLPNCFWRFKSGAIGSPEWSHPLHPGPIEHFEDLRPYHARRAPGFAEAHYRLEIRGKKRTAVVAMLMEIVEEL